MNLMRRFMPWFRRWTLGTGMAILAHTTMLSGQTTPEPASSAKPSDNPPAARPTADLPPPVMLPDNCGKSAHAGSTGRPNVATQTILPPGKAPKEEAVQTSVEGEPVWKGRNLQCGFEIRNTGNADLEIRPKST